MAAERIKRQQKRELVACRNCGTKRVGFPLKNSLSSCHFLCDAPQNFSFLSGRVLSVAIDCVRFRTIVWGVIDSIGSIVCHHQPCD
jgi:hypothetical protein